MLPMLYICKKIFYMKTVADYIIHRNVDMNGLVQMVHASIALGYQPYGNLNSFPIITDNFGNPSLQGMHQSICYIQAMVRYAAD
jgi:hypothetical protein